MIAEHSLTGAKTIDEVLSVWLERQEQPFVTGKRF